jgi:hypothetical protein
MRQDIKKIAIESIQQVLQHSILPITKNVTNILSKYQDIFWLYIVKKGTRVRLKRSRNDRVVFFAA